VIKLSVEEKFRIARGVAEQQGYAWSQLSLREQEAREREAELIVQQFELERACAS
jgi:hypothetical protein